MCGLLTGYRFVSFRIGSWMVQRENGRLRFHRYTLAGTAGQCLLAPPELTEGKIPYKLYNLGGVLANLLAAALAGRGARRDLGKDPAALRAFWVQLSMNARQAEGVPLREMPEEWFALPDGGLDNIMLASQAVLHANRLMSEQRFAETAQCIDALLQGDTAILSLHRKLLLCDRLTCALLTGEDAAPWLVRWNSKEMKAFRKQMRSFLSVQRTEYLAALLAERDAAKAEVFHRKFEQRAKTYPYAAEAADERALVELGAQMA